MYYQIPQGKMFALTWNKPVIQQQSNQAPLGNKIYKMNSPQAQYETHYIPVSKQFNYRLRIWVRRTSNDNVPSSTFYVGAIFQNYQKNHLPIQGRGGYYYIDGAQGSTLTNQWKFVEFYVGSDQQKRIPEQARFMAIYFLVNWGQQLLLIKRVEVILLKYDVYALVGKSFIYYL